MRALLRTVAILATVLGARSALAQVVDPEIFGDGKPPVFREEDNNRRFLKTGIYAGLVDPPREPECKRIVATLLVAYAEALPYLHRKDQQFYVDPALLNVLNRTVVTPDFPGSAFLIAMIRRTFIDKKVPEAWIKTAETLRAQLNAPISTNRMHFAAESLGLIDSCDFTVPALIQRYNREVTLAPSVAVDSADDKFRDKYMDRDVTWGNLVLYDVAKQAPTPAPKPVKTAKKGKKAPPPPPPPPEVLPTWAVMFFPIGVPPPTVPGIPPQPVPHIEIRARLREDQIVDLSKLVRGQRVLIKGHLWEIGRGLSYVEVRDAEIFPDADWSAWPGLTSPQDVAKCSIAVNDLSPYGYVPKTEHTAPPNPYIHNANQP